MLDIIAVKEAVSIFDLIEPDTQLHGGPVEYSGACPRCGGTDRFHVNREKGWFCRQCAGDHWHDALDYIMWRDRVDFIEAYKRLGGTNQMSQAERDTLRAERERREAEQQAARAAKQAERLAQLQDDNPHMKYWQDMDETGRERWYKRGLSDLWIDYFKVGYSPARVFTHDDQQFTSPSLTIPSYRAKEPQAEPDCVYLVHRLLLDNPPGGKYRPHMSGLSRPLFRCDIFAPEITGEVLLIEGEIKAMVTWAQLQDHVDQTHPRGVMGRLSVIGSTTKNLNPAQMGELAGASMIWICLDPDARQEADKLARNLGTERCRIIDLPGKIDDMLNAGIFEIGTLGALLRGARRVK